MRDNVLPPAGSGKRPNAIDAAERLIARTLPCFLPLTPRERRVWQAAGISADRRWATIVKLAMHGRVEILLVDGQMVVASTCSDRPIECRIEPQHFLDRRVASVLAQAALATAFPADCPTTTATGDAPAALEEVTP